MELTTFVEQQKSSMSRPRPRPLNSPIHPNLLRPPPIQILVISIPWVVVVLLVVLQPEFGPLEVVVHAVMGILGARGPIVAVRRRRLRPVVVVPEMLLVLVVLGFCEVALGRGGHGHGVPDGRRRQRCLVVEGGVRVEFGGGDGAAEVLVQKKGFKGSQAADAPSKVRRWRGPAHARPVVVAVVGRCERDGRGWRGIRLGQMAVSPPEELRVGGVHVGRGVMVVVVAVSRLTLFAFGALPFPTRVLVDSPFVEARSVCSGSACRVEC